MKGYIHSIESCGTVDGPGVRYVVFFQGCPLRCQYCHNPDTWKLKGGREMTVGEVLEGFYSNLPFYKNGGVTATGGEPLVQIDFLIELFENLKNRGIHTCIDTSGVLYNPKNAAFMDKLDRLMNLTDLILLDIKHIGNEEHQVLTGSPNTPVLGFARYLEQKEIPVWIRHVVVPGLTDREDDLYRLGYFIGSLGNLKALDVLPYHSMGRKKYEELGMDYPLKGVPDLPKERAARAKDVILKGIRARRTESTMTAQN